jgi:O-succinylbenzoate synthase
VFVVHELCQQFNLPMWCGGMYESGIGRAFNAFVAALPGFTLPADCTPPERAYGFDLIDPPLSFNGNGEMVVPSGPGLGVTVNEARISEYSTERVVLGFED